MLRLRANLRAFLHELASAALAALAFGLLLCKILPARLPVARIGGVFADVFGEFGRGGGHRESVRAGLSVDFTALNFRENSMSSATRRSFSA